MSFVLTSEQIAEGLYFDQYGRYDGTFVWIRRMKSVRLEPVSHGRSNSSWILTRIYTPPRFSAEPIEPHSVAIDTDSLSQEDIDAAFKWLEEV